MGLQAPCRDNRKKKPMHTQHATEEGTAAAAGAVSAARALGILPGSAIYADIEGSTDLSILRAFAEALGEVLHGLLPEQEEEGFEPPVPMASQPLAPELPPADRPAPARVAAVVLWAAVVLDGVVRVAVLAWGIVYF